MFVWYLWHDCSYISDCFEIALDVVCVVDSELAKRLRDELDHADQLDNNLIKQLSSIAPVDEDTLSSSSPVKEADVSERLQVRRLMLLFVFIF